MGLGPSPLKDRDMNGKAGVNLQLHPKIQLQSASSTAPRYNGELKLAPGNASNFKLWGTCLLTLLLGRIYEVMMRSDGQHVVFSYPGSIPT